MGGCKAHASRIAGVVAIIVLLILILLPPLEGFADSPSNTQAVSLGSYVYSVKPSGIADVTVVIRGVSGSYEVYVRVDPGIINESLTAFDQKGNILPTQLVNKTLVDVLTANTTNEVIVEYVAIVGNVTGNIVSIAVSPYGNATVKLPPGTALLYFTGSPDIRIVSSSITLYYPSPGHYNVSFIVKAQTTTTTTAVPATSTTTATSILRTTTSTTTSTPTITTTTTTALIITTTTPHTTTTTVPTTTVPTTTPTTTTTAPSFTAVTTATHTITHTTTKPLTTPTQTSTSRKTSKATTSPASSRSPPTTTHAAISGWGNVLIWVVLAAIVALIGALIAFTKHRRGGGVVAGKPPSGGGAELIEATSLDERDITLLSLISEKETTISELAKRSGLSKSVVWRRIRKLSNLGLISKEDLGVKTILRVTRDGLDVLRRFRST